jgi:hypothetical protein
MSQTANDAQDVPPEDDGVPEIQWDEIAFWSKEDRALLTKAMEFTNLMLPSIISANETVSNDEHLSRSVVVARDKAITAAFNFIATVFDGATAGPEDDDDFTFDTDRFGRDE